MSESNSLLENFVSIFTGLFNEINLVNILFSFYPSFDITNMLDVQSLTESLINDAHSGKLFKNYFTRTGTISSHLQVFYFNVCFRGVDLVCVFSFDNGLYLRIDELQNESYAQVYGFDSETIHYCVGGKEVESNLFAERFKAIESLMMKWN